MRALDLSLQYLDFVGSMLCFFSAFDIDGYVVQAVLRGLFVISEM